MSIESLKKALLPVSVTEAHQELIEKCKIDIDKDFVIIECPNDLEKDLFLGKWDIADAFTWLELPDRVIFQTTSGSKREFSVTSLRKQSRIMFDTLTRRSPMETTVGREEGLTLLPPDFGRSSLINYVNNSRDRLVLVLEETQKPIAVSSPYGEWTGRDPLDWLGDSNNGSRWLSGELARMQSALEDPRNSGFLKEFEYTANFWQDNSPCIWVANIERFDLQNLCCKNNEPVKPRKWARLVHFLHREPKLSQI